jgi:hypothetical protein
MSLVVQIEERSQTIAIDQVFLEVDAIKLHRFMNSPLIEQL